MQLENALRIDGAEAVAVMDAGRVTWWAGAREPGPEDAAAAAGLAAAAAVLAGDDGFGDVLVTTGTTFHVLRPMDGDRVAHLVLRKGVARLGLARHEFKMLVERSAEGELPAPALPAAPARHALTAAPEPRNALLPRRLPARTRNGPPAAATAVEDLPPGWLDLVGQPFETDDGVLDRILGTLKQL